MPYGWICRVERLFRTGQDCEAAKLVLVSESLEGDGLDWYIEERSKESFVSWSNFKKGLLAHFALAKGRFQSDVIRPKETVSTSAKKTELGFVKASPHTSTDILSNKVVQDTGCEQEAIPTSKKSDFMDVPASHIHACLPSVQRRVQIRVRG